MKYEILFMTRTLLSDVQIIQPPFQVFIFQVEKEVTHFMAQRLVQESEKLDEENERIVAIEITGNSQEKLCLINTYMQAKHSSVNSQMEYSECHDTIHSLIIIYRHSHKLIIRGDFNGTLLKARPYNKPDGLLQALVEEHCIDHVASILETFFLSFRAKKLPNRLYYVNRKERNEHVLHQ